MATRLAQQRNYVTITPTTNQSADTLAIASNQMSPSRNGTEIITITSTGASVATSDTTVVNRNGLQPVSFVKLTLAFISL